MARSQRKRDELDRREQDVLASALALFSGESWQSVTMDQIAAGADVSKGTLYNHFASKDDIYARLLIDLSETVLERLDRLDSNESPEQRVRATLAVLWNSYRENSHFRRISYHCEREGFRAALSPPARARIELVDRRFLRHAFDIIEAGIARGQFRDQAPQSALIGPSLVLAGMSRLLWNSEASAAEDDPRFQSICEFVLAGLAVRDA